MRQPERAARAQPLTPEPRACTAPLLRAAQLGGLAGDKVTVLPGAVAPEGAGDADEPWEAPESDDEESE